MKKTWKLINELNSRTVRKLKNFGNYFGDQVVTSPVEMAETFNSYFSNTAPHRTATHRTLFHKNSQPNFAILLLLRRSFQLW
jgi:hypothetical protein